MLRLRRRYSRCAPVLELQPLARVGVDALPDPAPGRRAFRRHGLWLLAILTLVIAAGLLLP